MYEFVDIKNYIEMNKINLAKYKFDFSKRNGKNIKIIFRANWREPLPSTLHHLAEM